jgi:hexosaminidase
MHHRLRLLLCLLALPARALLLPVWPAPSGPVSSGSATVLVSPTLAVSGAEAWPDVQAGVARFLARAFPHPLPPAHRRPPASAPAISALVFTVANGSAALQLGVSEAYTLTVPADPAQPLQLAASTQFGALAGLETLSQLLAFDAQAKAYSVAGAPLRVEDAPAFPWRGLLVDTARHFLPPATLRAALDAMAYAKLNTLHWHAVDAQSWPLESAAWPALWAGAFSPRERYTVEDVAGVVEYARARGIRTVFEVDHPGHASSACKGYPQLCPQDCAWDAGANSVPLAPASNATWAMLSDTLAELAALSPDAFLHLGGDEVDTTCWALDGATRAWAAAHNLSVGQIYGEFVQRLNAVAVGLGRSPLRWEDAWLALGPALHPATVIHVWLSPDTLRNATAAGYRALYSYQGVYNDIFDYQGGWYLNGLWQPWQQMYDVDILAGLKGGGGNASLVLGGEAAQWGESADGSDVLQTIWPRAAAIAERLWSYNMALNSSDAGVAERLANFRCLLLQRGVPASPLNADLGRSPPPGPGSCMTQ